MLQRLGRPAVLSQLFSASSVLFFGDDDAVGAVMFGSRLLIGIAAQ